MRADHFVLSLGRSGNLPINARTSACCDVMTLDIQSRCRHSTGTCHFGGWCSKVTCYDAQAWFAADLVDAQVWRITRKYSAGFANWVQLAERLFLQVQVFIYCFYDLKCELRCWTLHVCTSPWNTCTSFHASFESVAVIITWTFARLQLKVVAVPQRIYSTIPST